MTDGPDAPQLTLDELAEEVHELSEEVAALAFEKGTDKEQWFAAHDLNGRAIALQQAMHLAMHDKILPCEVAGYARTFARVLFNQEPELRTVEPAALIPIRGTKGEE